MLDVAFDFLKQLLMVPSPSGFEEPVQEVVRAWAASRADEVRTDTHGNVIAIKNPGGSPRLLLDGHCDQIGLMVSHIDEGGFLYCQPIGGWDAQILLGQRMTVYGKNGPLDGVIARKPKHLLTPEEQKQVPEITALWIDIGAKDKAEAAKYVEVGDPVTPLLGHRRLLGDLLSGPKMDDTTGLFVVFDVLRRLEGRKIRPALHVVSAVQEEIGLRGAQTAAFGVDPHVAVAVDVTHATDCPTIDKKAHGDVRLGSGPVLFRGANINPIVFRLLRETADEAKLPYQLKGAPHGTANDANAIQLNRAGVAVGLLGLPNRYMHSPVEVVNLKDLDAASELLTKFVLTLSEDVDFTPGLGGRVSAG